MEKGSHRGREPLSQSYWGYMGKQEDQGPMTPSRLLPSRLPDAGLEPSTWCNLLGWPRSFRHLQPPGMGCPASPSQYGARQGTEWAVHSQEHSPSSHQRLPGYRGTWWGCPSPYEEAEMAEHHRHKVRNTERARTTARTAHAWRSSHPAQVLHVRQLPSVHLAVGINTQVTALHRIGGLYVQTWGRIS